VSRRRRPPRLEPRQAVLFNGADSSTPKDLPSSGSDARIAAQSPPGTIDPQITAASAPPGPSSEPPAADAERTPKQGTDRTQSVQQTLPDFTEGTLEPERPGIAVPTACSQAGAGQLRPSHFSKKDSSLERPNATPTPVFNQQPPDKTFGGATVTASAASTDTDATPQVQHTSKHMIRLRPESLERLPAANLTPLLHLLRRLDPHGGQEADDGPHSTGGGASGTPYSRPPRPVDVRGSNAQEEPNQEKQEHTEQHQGGQR
jgi:hypothetical protein